MLRRQQIEELIFDKQKKTFGNMFRTMHVTYVYGVSGTGKTSDIVKNHGGYDGIYRVTDYKNPYDEYHGEDIIVYEEFRCQFHISTILNAIDGHPYNLGCRYHNKVACYTQVFFTSNVPLCDLYRNVQQNEPETWKAFLRRIHTVRIYDENGYTDMSIDKYISKYSPFSTLKTDPDGFIQIPDDVQIELPFN